MNIVETLYLNNSAVEHLQNGQFRKAIKQLRLALEEVKVFLRERVLAPPDREFLDRDDDMEMRLFPQQQHQQQQQNILVDAVSITCNDVSTNVLPLFCNTFRFQTNTRNHRMLLTDAKHGPAFLVGTILFNLSMAYHCRGACGKGQDLSNALKLYNIALSTLQNELSGDVLLYYEETSILLMAILNNIASIHAHFFDTREALSYLNCLQDVVVQYCDLTANAPFGEQYLFFQSNLLVTDASFHLAPVA